MVNCVCKCEIVLERRLLIMRVTLGCLKIWYGKAVDFKPLTIFLEGEGGEITIYRNNLPQYVTFHTSMLEMFLRSSAV